MSSRRKSKPFRRLDSICSQLQEKHSTAEGNGDTPDKINSNHLSTECNTVDTPVNNALNSKLQVKGGDESNQQSNVQNDTARENEQPPEGVYMIMPESVDELERSVDKAKETHQKTAEETSTKRKFSLDEDSSNMEDDGRKSSGLDLSVKRRRLEDQNKVAEGTIGQNTEQSDLPDQSNVAEKLIKYQQVMKLVEYEGLTLPNALQKVDMLPQEFFQCYQISSHLQMKKAAEIENSSQIPNPADNLPSPAISNRTSPVMNELLSKVDHRSDGEVMSEQLEHQERIQALLREANNKILQQQQQQMVSFNNSQPANDAMQLNSYQPTDAEAFSRMDDNEKKQEMMKMLLLKAQSYFNNKPQNQPTMSNAQTSSGFENPTPTKINTITAGTVSTGIGSIKKGTLDPATFDEDVFDQYITKYTPFQQCSFANCPHRNKDHYHCSDKDCHYQRFTNRADVIRHYNMHKKRDNSLAHGFMRFAPTEDCSSKFENCHLNGKSTHYHCLQTDCNKVYTSTSDVMTHENFHKKNYQFVCIGFKRYRATESCGLQNCMFYNQRTTHFHCTRRGCDFTFKNKCDIDKHKSYHIRDDSYASLGFKKFFKNEFCGRDNCAWNHNSNHFHCLQCQFTFTSTGQMVSHKKKHERGEIPTSSLKRSHNMGSQNPVYSHFRTTPSLKPDIRTPLPLVHKQRPPNVTISQASTKPLPNIPENMTRSPYYPPFRPHILLHPSRVPVLPSGVASTPQNNFLSSSAMISPYVAAVASRFISNQNHFQTISGGSSAASSVPMIDANMLQDMTRKAINSTTQVTDQFRNTATDSTSLQEPITSIAQPAVASEMLTSTSSPIQKISQSPLLTRPQNDSSSVPSDLPPPYNNINNTVSASNPTSNCSSPQQMVNNATEQHNEDSRESTNQEVQELWQNSVKGGLISPDMARSAAAAINSSMGRKGSESRQDSTLDLSAQQSNAIKSEAMEKENKNTSMSYANSPENYPIFKYFAGAKAHECWLSECDFMHKHHFHCMVDNCAAMFATQDNVLRHTRFHQALEEMGAKLPIHSAPNVTEANENQQAEEAPAKISSPPPGFITLESHTGQNNAQVPNNAAVNLSATNKPNCELTTPLPTEASTTQTMQKYAAQLFAASALLKDLKTEPQLPSNNMNNATESKPMILPSSLAMCPTPNNAITYMAALQNPTALSALLSKTPQSQEFLQKLISGQAGTVPLNPLLNHQSAFNPIVKHESQDSVNQNDKKNIGYIHIRAGSACLKPDCKYAMQTHWHCMMPRCRYVCKSLGKAQSHRQAHDSLEAYARSAKLCFKSYTVKKRCPNPTCEFRLRGHYHCLKPGCQFATIGSSKLPWHMKKHEKIARREASGFKYYTKKDQCGRFDCKYNGLFSHYHCIRTGCRFAFQYKHQMSTHVRKHLRRMLGRTYNGAEGQTDLQDVDHSNVDSGDETLPLIIDEMDEKEQRPGILPADLDDSSNFNDDEESLDGSQALSGAQLEMLERTAKGLFNSTVNSSGLGNPGMESPTPEDLNNEADETLNNTVNSLSDENENDALDLSAVPSTSSAAAFPNNTIQMPVVNYNGDPITFQQIQQALKQKQDEPGLENNSSNENEDTSLTQNKLQEGMFNKFRLNNDVLEGFLRFENGEDCKEESCAFRSKVSHFHCIKDGCSYRFTGRTHMYKHQQHHERVAGLVQDDFKRFKIGQKCDDENCPLSAKNTHFHCLRCVFKCTDSAKVSSHRHQHIKSDSLVQSGFERFKGQEDCGKDYCRYRYKAISHFHCLKNGCQFTGIGKSRIEQHAKKHQNHEHNLSTLNSQQVHNTIASKLQQMAQMQISQQSGAEQIHNDAINLNTPLSPCPTSSDDGSVNSNNEPTILSKFALYSQGNPIVTPVPMATSPANNTNGMITEGIGS